MFPPKLLALLIDANDRCFGCPRGCPREPPGHTPPAFLFLSSTMSNSGESFVTLRSNASGKNRCRSPFGRYRQLRASCIRNTHRDVGTGERRASLSGVGYMWSLRGVSSTLSRKFAAAETPWKTWIPRRLRDVTAGPVAAPSSHQWRNRPRRIVATIATEPRLVNGIETVCCETVGACIPWRL